MADKLENITIALGTAIGLSQIQTILGIIVLGFQVLLIIYKVFNKIRKRIANKEYDKIEEDLEEAKNELEKLKNSK